MDFPENVLVFVQERGRAVRWDEANPSSDEYVLCVLLWSCIHMITRFYSEGGGLLDNNIPDTNMNTTLAQLLPVNEYRCLTVEDLNEYIIGLILLLNVSIVTSLN